MPEFNWQLFRYSEWLDSQKLIKSDQGPEADKRTHEQLVSEFIAQDHGGS